MLAFFTTPGFGPSFLVYSWPTLISKFLTFAVGPQKTAMSTNAKPDQSMQLLSQNIQTDVSQKKKNSQRRKRDKLKENQKKKQKKSIEKASISLDGASMKLIKL